MHMSEKEEKKESGLDSELLQNLALEQYLSPRRFGSKFWLSLVLVVIFIGLAAIYKLFIIDNSVSPEELKASIELFDISSIWVVKNRVDTQEFKGVVVVPQISFRVRNTGEQELKNVFLLGVFSFLDTGRVIGEGYETVLSGGLLPGQESDRVELTSALGYRASSKRAFAKHSKDWRSAYVEIFVRSRQSKLFFLKSFYIRRRIKGTEIDVKI
jgi:hypothetical protein